MGDTPVPTVGAPPPLPARPSSTAPATEPVLGAVARDVAATPGPPGLPPRRAIQVSVTPATPEMGSPADTQASPARPAVVGVPQMAPLPLQNVTAVDGGGRFVQSAVGGQAQLGQGEEVSEERDGLNEQAAVAVAAPSSAPTTASIPQPPWTAPPALQPSEPLSPGLHPTTSPSPSRLPPRPASPFNPAKAEAALIDSAATIAKDTAIAAKQNPLDVGLALLMAGLVMVAYWRLATWWLCLVGVGGLVYMHGRAQGRAPQGGGNGDEDGDEVVGRMKGDAKAAVQWV